MKRWLLPALFLCFTSLAYAFEPVWRASHTATADTTQILCPSKSYLIGTSTSTTGGRGIVHAVCVNDSPTFTGTFTIYDASSTAVNPVAVIRSTAVYTAGCSYFDFEASSGIVYTNSTTNDTTILYSCY